MSRREEEPRTLEDAQSGPRIERVPRWNERAGKHTGVAPQGGLDESRLGGRGNQATQEVGGAPNPETGK